MSDLDAYLPPYQAQDHLTLWKALQAGDPDQIDGLAATWVNPIRSTLDDFVLDLDRDLKDLMNYWSEKSAGGAEFKRRLSLVVQFADQLAGHVGTIKDNLHAWKTALETAQSNAPDPADTDDNGRTIAGAAIGAALGPAGALIGGLIGHEQDEEQRRQARDKLVMIMAELAREYDTKQEVKTPPPLPPVDLPDSVNHGRPGMKAIDGTVIPTASAFTPKSIKAASSKDPAPEKPAETPVIGPSGGDAHLLGVGDGTLTGVNLGTSGTLGFAGTGGGASFTTPLSGGAGLFPGAAALRGARPGASTSLEGSKAQAPVRPETAKTVPNAKAPARPAVARTTEDDDPRDKVHETWLTEDDMVWGDGSEPGPATLGARFVPEPIEAARPAPEPRELEGPPDKLV